MRRLGGLCMAVGLVEISVGVSQGNLGTIIAGVATFAAGYVVVYH